MCSFTNFREILSALYFIDTDEIPTLSDEIQIDSNLGTERPGTLMRSVMMMFI